MTNKRRTQGKDLAQKREHAVNKDHTGAACFTDKKAEDEPEVKLFRSVTTGESPF